MSKGQLTPSWSASSRAAASAVSLGTALTGYQADISLPARRWAGGAYPTPKLPGRSPGSRGFSLTSRIADPQHATLPRGLDPPVCCAQPDPITCATAGCERPAAASPSPTTSLVFASILAVTGTGQSVVISALRSASTVLSGVPAHAALETSHTDLADVITLGAGA